MPSVEKFKKSLENFLVKENIIAKINEGYETIVSKTPKKVKAAYFKRSIDILNEHVEEQLQKEILEWNACCKGGAREKASKSFAKEHEHLSLDEKLLKIREVPHMGQPVRNVDGTITINAVNYSNGERYLCACSNYNGLKYDYSVSKNYCFCCTGHFKYHYEIMLGVNLTTLEIVSSPLDSNGQNPCVISYIIDDSNSR